MELALARRALADARLPAGSALQIDAALRRSTADNAAGLHDVGELLEDEGLRAVRAARKDRIRTAAEALATCLRDAPLPALAAVRMTNEEADAEVVAADLTFPDAPDSVVPTNATAFSIELRDVNGTGIAIDHIDAVELTFTGGIADYTGRVAIAPRCAGCVPRIVVTDCASFIADLLGHRGPYVFSVRATDAAMKVFSGSAAFDLGRHQLTGTLLPPASGQAPTVGVPVVVTNQRDGLSFWTTTTAGGAISFATRLPDGVYLATGEVVSGGIRYFADGAFVADGDIQFSMRLRTIASTPVSGLAATGKR